MNGNPVSFFFLGTACHRSNYEDVLTHFYKAVEKNPNCRLFDGVGSESKDAQHPTPGQYVYDHENNTKIPMKGKTLQGVRDLMHRIQGCLAGEGTDELLFEAILYLERLKKDGKLPEPINLYGYSRGADTCMRLANLIDSLYPGVEVNMFLIEQVAGPGRGDDPSSYTIPPNVKKFESAIMLHEYKPGFDPQDRDSYIVANPTKTEMTMKVYPGWHGKAMCLTGQECTDHVPRLLHDDFFKFAKATGTLTEKAAIPPYKVMHGKWCNYGEQFAEELTLERRFKEYDGILENWWSYSKGTALNTRTVLTRHKEYTQLRELFVNQEHGELFQELYPALFDWFFNGAKKNYSPEQRTEELAKLAAYTTFYQKFCKFYGINDPKNFPLPSKGKPYIHPKFGSPIVTDEFSFFKHSVLSIINYTLYHLKENNMQTRIAKKILRKGIKQAHSSDAPTETLLKAIDLASRYLSSEKNNGYMAKQLKKLSVRPTQFLENICSPLEKYGKNPKLSSEIQDILVQKERELYVKMIEIKNTSKFDPEKIREAKLLISELSEELGKKVSDLSDVLANTRQPVHMERNFFKELDSPHRINQEISTIKEIISSLNQLATPGFGEISLAQTMAKQFAAYYKRNMFWEGVYKIFSAIMPFKLSEFVSPARSKLANETRLQLDALDSSGKGNNLGEISKVLQFAENGSNQIHLEEYRTERKLIKEDFDKIVETCRRDLWPEVQVDSLLSLNPAKCA